MNRNEKVKFLQDLKEGKANIDNLHETLLDYSQMTDDELRRVIHNCEVYKDPNVIMPDDEFEFFIYLKNKYGYAKR
jgi:hypothetical protein